MQWGRAAVLAACSLAVASCGSSHTRTTSEAEVQLALAKQRLLNDAVGCDRGQVAKGEYEDVTTVIEAFRAHTPGASRVDVARLAEDLGTCGPGAVTRLRAALTYG